MHFIETILIIIWIWEFVRTHLYKTPDWFVHIFLMPGLAYLSWIIPDPYKHILAAVGGVLTIYMIFNTPERTTTKRTIRRSNIPPLP